MEGGIAMDYLSIMFEATSSGLYQEQNVFTRLPSFEVYDANFKDGTSRIQIYAPILTK